MKPPHVQTGIRFTKWLVIIPAAVVSVWLAADRAGNIISGEEVPPTAGLEADRATIGVAKEVPRAAGHAADRGHTAAIVGPGDAGPREVLFTYMARLPQIPSGAQDIRVWIPLAKTGSEQRIMRREVRSSWPSTITADPEYGNEMLYLSLQPPFPPYVEVVVDYEARLLGNDAAAADRPPTPDELPRYLQAGGLVIIDEEVRARAALASRGRSTAADRARGIYEFVLWQVAYDKSVPGWGQGDTRRVCLIGKGNCTDFHSLFISMARASQIPSRFKIGVVIPPPTASPKAIARPSGRAVPLHGTAVGGGMIPQEASGTIPGYHCWAEFYEQGQGWVPVDASEAWKHPELADYYFGARDGNRLLMSVGRDIQLVPRQQGEPINIFFYPHVEVDGREFPGVETEFRFRNLQPGRTG